MRKVIVFSLLLLVGLSSCKSKKNLTNQQYTQQAKVEVYQPKKREFRAAWIPNAWRAEYMSRSSEYIKNSLKKRLDLLQRTGFNVVIFQVRSEADAWYYSPYEPWSRTLTGKQGIAPSPMWDPLEFMVAECHSRGMELHAWINPYRAATNVNSKLSSNHPYYKHPEWFFKYGNQLFFNPALPAVQRYTCQVIDDIVERYDIDAIHIDDYFYPYPITGEAIPDKADYSANPRGFTNIGDWRRDNVNQLISQISATIKARKPYVRFGISPFGIYRNEKSDPKRGSKTNGLQNYDDLYADILFWDAMGWVDYIIPQIYWEIGHKAAEHTELTRWWSQYIHLAQYYIGQDVKRTMDQDELHTKLNISTQVSQGLAMWPADELFSNYKGITTEIRTKYWNKIALVPASDYPTHLRRFEEPKRETSIVTHEGVPTLFWEPDMPYPAGLETKYFVIYIHKPGEKLSKAIKQGNLLTITQEPFFTLPKINGKEKVAFTITRVNRYNQEILIAHNIKTKI